MGQRGFRNRRDTNLADIDTDIASDTTIVVAPTSSELVHWVTARHHHDSRVVPIVPVPSGQQGLELIGEAVLTGLGKPADRRRRKRSSHLAATAWLTHGDHTDAVIVDAQQLSSWLLPDIVTWLTGCGLHLTLILGTTSTPEVDNEADIELFANELRDAWDATRISLDALKKLHPDQPSTKTEPARSPSVLPILPRCDGIIFREQCRQLLQADDFARVDAAFVAAVQHHLERFDSAIRSPDRHKSRVLARELRTTVEHAPDTETVILTVRAAQVAALRLGWLLNVDIIRLVAATTMRPRLGLARHHDAWQRLAEYRDPDYAAAAALHTAGLGTGEFTHLQVNDVRIAEHTTVKGHIVPEPGARFVRCLWTLRQLEGAQPTDGLFGTTASPAISPSQAHRLLSSTKHEIGTAFIDTSHGRKQPDAIDWLRSYGIEFTTLSKKPSTR